MEVIGFEPIASYVQGTHSTKLSYTPYIMKNSKIYFCYNFKISLTYSNLKLKKVQITYNLRITRKLTKFVES